MAGESFVSWTVVAVTTASDVRKMTGLLQESDIPTGDLEDIIKRAQVSVVHDISQRVHDVQMWGVLDGANTRFEVPARFTGRVLLDAQKADGGTEKETQQVYLRRVASGTSPRIYDAATISSVDALHGQVVLSAAPNPATYDSVRFTGLLVPAAITKNQFKTCVELLAAAQAVLRARGRGMIPAANPQAGRPSTREVGGVDFFSLYEREVRKMQQAPSRAASVRTSLPYIPDGAPVTW